MNKYIKSNMRIAARTENRKNIQKSILILSIYSDDYSLC